MKLHVIVAVTLATQGVAVAGEFAPWPKEAKREAVNGCREAILDNAEREYMARNKLDSLPEGFREKTAPIMEQYLGVCDCVFDRLETAMSFEDFIQHPDEAREKMAPYMAVCSAEVRRTG